MAAHAPPNLHWKTKISIWDATRTVCLGTDTITTYSFQAARIDATEYVQRHYPLHANPFMAYISNQHLGISFMVNIPEHGGWEVARRYDLDAWKTVSVFNGKRLEAVILPQGGDERYFSI
jgi:hypothetical protein